MEKASHRQRQAEKRRAKKRNVTIGSVAAGLAVVAGLSVWAVNNEGHDDNATAKISCEAPSADSWNSVPGNFAASAIAKHLGVSEDQVRRGAYGPATCEQPASPADIDSGPVLLNIRNIGNTCMAVGLQTEVFQATNNVLAVCAAPRS